MYSAIIGDLSNPSQYSTILGGYGGRIFKSDMSGIFGGFYNHISGSGNSSAIIGGKLGRIEGYGSYNTLLGGFQNKVETRNINSKITLKK